MPKTKKLSSTINCPVDNLNRAMAVVDQKIQAYEELRLIRIKVETSGLTQPLYDFLNKNSDLEKLFYGLPKHNPEASVESIEVSCELQCIDAALEGIFADIKEALRKLFAAFWSYILDWIDTNRRLYFRLQRHKVALENSRNLYADDDTLKRIKGHIYAYQEEWMKMYDAVKSVSTSLDKLTSNNVPAFIQSERSNIAKSFAVFGTSLSESGIIDDTPPFSKQDRVVGMGGAGWTYQTIKTTVNKAMELLKKEETSRTQFNAIRRAFDDAIKKATSANDVNSMKMLVAVCKRNKLYASTVARAICDVCVIAKANAKLS